MTATLGGDVGTLRGSMTGPVFTPEDVGYDEARKVWNADIDRRPALIARCLSTEDVSAAVEFAREAGLEITVRAGAHSVPGHSVADGAFMIDLSSMREVTVDPETRRARVQGGALISDLDAATQIHGLAVPMGAIGHTGVAGLTLGGGMGWLSRQAGLSIDNLVAAQVVLADGSIVGTNADDHPDLFWAIRGGGGNFGVVTEFEFALHEAGPMVDFGLFFWTVDQDRQALRLIRDVVADLPDSLNVIVAILNAPPAPFVPEQYHLQPGYALLITGFADSHAHADVVGRIRAALPPAFDFITEMPYTALQQMFDEANGWGLHYYDKGLYFDDLTDETINVLAEYGPRRTSPMSIVFIYRLGGAYCRVDDADTAFSGTRRAQYFAFFIAAAPEADQLPPEREWVRSIHDALLPFTPAGTYVNALTEPSPDRVRASYGNAKYDRLAKTKARYDPDNLFHRNANIVPTTGT